MTWNQFKVLRVLKGFKDFEKRGGGAKKGRKTGRKWGGDEKNFGKSEIFCCNRGGKRG
jgi:hypothetical protein